ncbi:hypothetical protein LSCM4_07893 [Leishmania orientalis]|uniref:N-acetyltransferase domain-containing protein n=1 Tax=Leishmania orientalis TaxID=2249476 RepID=A0A836KSS9_9TRYP|nr:hypothetical protein LSCM4_07893 [Leishmania orientalis]
MASASTVYVKGACATMRDDTAEARWGKLDEVHKMLSSQSDSKELFTKFTVLRSVVGEAKPVFSDSVLTRVKVSCEEQTSTEAEECDEFEPVSMHVVAYFNYTQFMEEMAELVVQARLLRSIGMEGSGLRFQRRKRNISASRDEPRAGSSGYTGKPTIKAAGHEPTYQPVTLIPVGALRLRRVAKVSGAGELAEFVAKIERVCVVKSMCCFGVGRILMTAAEKIARDAFHVRWALLYAHLSSKEFYAKTGYAPKEGQTCMGLHAPHVLMVKCLAGASM